MLLDENYSTLCALHHLDLVQEPSAFLMESFKTSSYESMQDAELKFVFLTTAFVLANTVAKIAGALHSLVKSSP